MPMVMDDVRLEELCQDDGREGEIPNRVEQPLHLVSRLVRDLNAAGIAYCHWKSNEHLADSLAGTNPKDDLDILIAREDAPRAEAILAGAGFKQFVAVPAKRYNGITDFLGYDEPSGRIIHLHTHYALSVGAKGLKEYTLPWDADVLASASPARGGTPMPIPTPEVEMLLLLVRACLNVRVRDRVLSARHRRQLRGDFERERAWLAERLDTQALRAATERWLAPSVWPLVQRAACEPAEPRTILELRSAVLRDLLTYRTCGQIVAVFAGWRREINRMFGVVNKRYLRWPIPWGRTAARGGLIISVLGSDGAGKSTLTREINDWLRPKIDVLPIYFGSGDGPSSLPRKFLIVLRKTIFRAPRAGATAEARSSDTTPATKRRLSIVGKVGLLAWGVLLAAEKRNKLKSAWRASSRGMIVVADRYPQTQTLSFNDGPLLQDFAESGSRLLRAIARWELSIYALTDTIVPNLAIKLDVPVDVALARKPDMARAAVERRVQAVGAFKFPASTRVVVIAADSPFSEVLSQAKTAIWDQV